MGHTVPENQFYSKEHEWAQVNDGVATIGITDYAQSALGDIVFVELPEAGTTLTQGEAFGVVESIKSVSDLYAPLSGEVIEVNSSLCDSPESCNSNAYDAWMVKIKLSNTNETKELFSPSQYTEFCNSL